MPASLWSALRASIKPALETVDAQADVSLPEAEARDPLPYVNRLPMLYDPQAETLPPQILIISGDGIPVHTILAPKIKRTYRPQLAIGTFVTIVLVIVLMTALPLSNAITSIHNPFRALAAAIIQPPAATSFTYQVASGDTYDRIAQHFHVTVNGIYRLNHLYAGQEAKVGQVIHISVDPTYGTDFTPPPMPLAANPGSVGVTNTMSGCLFCARGAWTNGPNGVCAPASGESIVEVDHFALMPPDPSSHWVRGFTWSHNGIDISTGDQGTPIVAAQAGEVIYAGWDPYGAGNAIKINHCGGLATSYSHLAKSLVKSGQMVQAGQLIGYQGSTGNSTGPHLHFMTWWNNLPFDPLCVYGVLDGVSSESHYGGCPAPHHKP